MTDTVLSPKITMMRNKSLSLSHGIQSQMGGGVVGQQIIYALINYDNFFCLPTYGCEMRTE